MPAELADAELSAVADDVIHALSSAGVTGYVVAIDAAAGVVRVSLMAAHRGTSAAAEVAALPQTAVTFFDDNQVPRPYDEGLGT